MSSSTGLDDYNTTATALRVLPISIGDEMRLNNICPTTQNMANEFNETPCLLAARLIHSCPEAADYPIVPLEIFSDTDHYEIPDSNQASDCICSLPVYNLIQACGSCQTGPIRATLYGYWLTNCGPFMNSTSFPRPLPKGTSIPSWALSVNLNNSSTPVAYFLQNGTRSTEMNLTLPLPTSSISVPAFTQTAIISNAPEVPQRRIDAEEKVIIIVLSTVSLVLVIILMLLAGIWVRNRRIRRKSGQQEVYQRQEKRGRSSSDPTQNLFAGGGSDGGRNSRSSSSFFEGEEEGGSFTSNSYSTTTISRSMTDRTSLGSTVVTLGSTWTSSSSTEHEEEEEDDADLVSLSDPFSDGHSESHHQQRYDHRYLLSDFNRLAPVHIGRNNNVQNRLDPLSSLMSSSSISSGSINSSNSVLSGSGGRGNSMKGQETGEENNRSITPSSTGADYGGS